jgi:alkylhydroperoxidase family enzyme
MALPPTTDQAILELLQEVGTINMTQTLVTNGKIKKEK